MSVYSTNSLTIICQSSKYTQTTATSNKVVFNVSGEKEIEIDQKTPTQFVIDLGAKADKLGTVEVIQLINTPYGIFDVPVGVKTAKLDGDKVNVELYNAVADKTNYLVKVEGYEDYAWTAYNGKPAEIILSGEKDKFSPLVVADGEQPIYVTILDENGVDITNDTYKGKIVYTLEEYPADSSYYVTSDGKLFFSKEQLTAVVLAEYQSGEWDPNTGEAVGNVPAKYSFISTPKEAVKIEKVDGSISIGAKDTKAKNVPFGDDLAKGVTLNVTVKTSDNNEPQAVVTDSLVCGGKISFKTATPDVAAIDADRNLYLFKEGTATILVQLAESDGNGGFKEPLPIGSIKINVQEARSLTNLSLNSSTVVIGTEVGFDEEEVTITAKDRYGDDITINKVEITGTSTLANEVKAGVAWTSGNTINLDGAILKAALEKNKTTMLQLSYKVKVNDAKETNLTVVVKAKGNGADQIGFAISDGKFDNVARNVDSTGAKSVVITAYLTNNGIKTGYQDIAAAPADVDANGVIDAFYVKVKKNNTDVTDKVTVTGSAITINFTGTKRDTSDTYDIVDYGLGSGTYTVELYKCVQQGAKKGLAKMPQTFTSTATYSEASYSSATRKIEVAKIRTERNKAIKSKVKTAVKKVDAAIANNDKAAAAEALKLATKTIDMATSKGVFHKNTASRKVSRLASSVNKMA